MNLTRKGIISLYHSTKVNIINCTNKYLLINFLQRYSQQASAKLATKFEEDLNRR